MEDTFSDSDIPEDQQDLYSTFLQDALAWRLDTTEDAVKLLRSIPTVATSSEAPITCLARILESTRIKWPIFELIRCHTKLWQLLPEENKDVTSSPDAALDYVKAAYGGLLELFLKDRDAPALIDPQTFQSISHRDLATFVHDFRLPIRAHSDTKPLVVIALPNGALLGITSLAVATWYTAVPVNASSGPDQFRIDVQQSEAKVILVLKADVTRLGLEDAWVVEAGIEVLVVEQNPDLTFDVTPVDGDSNFAIQQPTLNTPDDPAFILFTSGTSGTKKMVPITIHSVVAGVAFVGDSWGLTETDSCLNQMPLNHV